ncbi:unnamed protein product [Colias eurytheme]|nr:unnamed protein product [Colias eurytheme]
MAPKIPDRWIPYKAFGKVIEGTRIICFKVPLHRRWQSKNNEIWDIKTLLEKIPKLGAVIDLTNTQRYYDPQELQSAGVLHKKILMEGRVIPPEHKVTEFMDAVDVFLEKDDDSLVGVHCTHGLNRTGYMVCRYLRDRLRWPAASAIDKFETARGYKIERKVYIADLLGTKQPKSPNSEINQPTIIKPIRESHTDPILTRDTHNGHNKRRNNHLDYNWRDPGSSKDTQYSTRYFYRHASSNTSKF